MGTCSLKKKAKSENRGVRRRISSNSSFKVTFHFKYPNHSSLMQKASAAFTCAAGKRVWYEQG